jgi:hypothetical protein
MTLRQTLQAAPTKTKELIEKLRGTSNQALKTRESLFAELKSSSRCIWIKRISTFFRSCVRIPRRRLLPRTQQNRARSCGLGSHELDGAAKDNDAFSTKVGELQSLLPQHLRDERKQLLPAVSKALDEEEAANVAAAIEGGFAEAEEAKRRRSGKLQIWLSGRLRKRRSTGSQASSGACSEGRRAEAREQAEQVREAVKAPIVQAVEGTREAAAQAQGALAVYSGTFEKAAADIRAFSASRAWRHRVPRSSCPHGLIG